MPNWYAKLTQREKDKYRRIMTIEENIYSCEVMQTEDVTPYVPGATLEDGAWFFVANVTNQPYKIDIMTADYSSTDFRNLTRAEVKKIDFVFIEVDDRFICFQNVPKSKLISKRSIICLGDNFEYQDERSEIVINDCPDAIYDKEEDILYFKRLESITGIFNGIDMIFREATNEETEQFLNSDFINLRDGYTSAKVNIANRKRIALAQKTLAELDEDSKNNIFTYIGEYCPDLRGEDSSFHIGSEAELKLLLYGIEQRFYTTVVGEEKRIANSVVPFV